MQLSICFPILTVLLTVNYVQCFGCQYKPGLEYYPNAMCTKLPPAQDINIESKVHHMIAPWNRKTGTYDCTMGGDFGTAACCHQPVSPPRDLPITLWRAICVDTNGKIFDINYFPDKGEKGKGKKPPQ